MNEFRLRQVVLNVLSRASRAVARSPRRRAIVTCAAGADGGGEVVIEITDTADPISETVRAEALHRVCDAEAPPSQAAFGLWISHAIVRHAARTLELDRKPDGTVGRVRDLAPRRVDLASCVPDVIERPRATVAR